jgi:hypothetical protein
MAFMSFVYLQVRVIEYLKLKGIVRQYLRGRGENRLKRSILTNCITALLLFNLKGTPP